MKRKSRGWKWEKLLKPLKEAPGCEARVRTHSARHNADAEIRRIKFRLKQVAPFEDWEFHSCSYRSEEGEHLFAVYATYRGTMSVSEKNARDEMFRLRSEKRKKLMKANKLRKQLATADITDLTRARMGRR